MRAMTENPGTCFLQYPKFPFALVILPLMGALVFVLIPLKCLKELLHCLHLPSTQKLYFFTWSFTFFRQKFQFLVHVMLPIIAVASPTFSRESPSIGASSIYWYSFISGGSGTL